MKYVNSTFILTLLISLVIAVIMIEKASCKGVYSWEYGTCKASE